MLCDTVHVEAAKVGASVLLDPVPPSMPPLVRPWRILAMVSGDAPSCAAMRAWFEREGWHPLPVIGPDTFERTLAAEKLGV